MLLHSLCSALPPCSWRAGPAARTNRRIALPLLPCLCPGCCTSPARNGTSDISLSLTVPAQQQRSAALHSINSSIKTSQGCLLSLFLPPCPRRNPLNSPSAQTRLQQSCPSPVSSLHSTHRFTAAPDSSTPIQGLIRTRAFRFLDRPERPSAPPPKTAMALEARQSVPEERQFAARVRDLDACLPSPDHSLMYMACTTNLFHKFFSKLQNEENLMYAQ